MSGAGSAGFRLLRLATGPAAASRKAAPAAVAQLLVPGDSPIFAGHFPGRPLLPGIAHLALLQHVLAELAARGELPGDLASGTAIAEVRKLRLRRPVLPGDRVELRLLSVDAGGGVRFELLRQPAAEEPGERAWQDEPPRWDERGQPGELASEGAVRIGACGPPPARAPVPLLDGPPPAALPEAAGLLPHAPPARLLAAVLAAGAGGAVAIGVIPADHPLAAGGEAPGCLAIEVAAQAAAAVEALVRQPRDHPGAGAPGGRPRLGYLVGVRGTHLPATLPTARALRVTAVPTGHAAALSTYQMEVALHDAGAAPLAAGTISTFLPDL